MSMILLTNSNYAQNHKSKSTAVVVTINIETTPKKAFEYIVPVDLPHIFKRYKNLPAVTRTSNKERWYTPGMKRTVFFEDGHTAQEYLITVNPHSDFSYKIDGFTSSLKNLAKYIEGNWKFIPTKEGHTYIEWTYTIIPKNRFARFIVNSFVKKNVKVLLENALMILKNDLENEKTNS